MKTMIKIICFFIALCFFAPATLAQSERENRLDLNNKLQIMTELAGSVNSTKNKYGRVSMSSVKALSYQTTQPSGEQFNIGVSLLTQEDAIVSPGVTAILEF